MSKENEAPEIEEQSIDELIDAVELPDQEDEEIEEEEIEQEVDDLENEIENLEELEQEIEPEKEEKPNLVKHLRNELKEKNKALKEKEKRLKAYEEKKAELGELPPKPTLDDEDIDFDQDLYEQKLLDWNEQKRKHDKKANAQKEEQEQLQQDHEKKVENYRAAMDALPYDDTEDSEDTAKMYLDDTQQALILQATDDPAKMIYAIGKNEKLAEQLAGITNPVQFIAKVAKLEIRLNSTMSKKPKPSANSRVKSGSVSHNNSDAVLDKLREEASKTGDFTKVREHTKRVAKANQG